MTLAIEKKLSKELTNALLDAEGISYDSQLFEAQGVLQDAGSDQVGALEDMIQIYGPDTTVGDLLAMAREEKPKPFGLKDIVSWLKVW